MSRRPFSSEDKLFMAEHYGSRGPAWIARRLNRTVGSVATFGAAKGLQSTNAGRARKYVPSPEIDEVIRREYSDKSVAGYAKRAAARTGWSLDAIHKRAKFMGLTGRQAGQGSAARAPRTKKKTRKRECLRCDREFMSEGFYNRICPNCQVCNAAVHLPPEHTLVLHRSGSTMEARQ